MTDSSTDRRKRLAELSGDIDSAGSKNDLIDAIDSAIGVAAPDGDPTTLETLGKRYKDQADDATRLAERISKVAKKGIPDVWVGDTSVLAADAVLAAARAANEMSEAFTGGGKALITLSDALEAARTKDGQGMSRLREARGMLGGKDGFFDDLHENDEEEELRLKARSVASVGVKLRHEAAVAADDAARAAARELNKWAAEARTGKMATDELTAVDRLMLADTSNTDGDPEYNEILSANDLERAGQRMETLSAGDRARMEKLLHDAKTPQERAYLMKALAAGYSVDEVAAFGGKIHGKDPRWLQEHLAPVTTSYDPSQKGQESQDFNGKLWDQDGETCVPSSTVTARAMVDPVYALELTGGPDGTDDDPEHFRKRLTDEQLRLHEEGDGSNSGWPWNRHPSGMDKDGQEEISEKELSPHTGDQYDQQSMDGPDDRRNVLPDIEKSVAEGKPVPINIERYDKDGRHGHSMMIIGHEGNKLQIYNPWGVTTWVTEEEFIKGDLSAAADDRYSAAHKGNVDTVYIQQD
ncbi:peptidoglycan-binding protein [Streptomyces sp. NPDC057386]|uniref:peptidoglycan-binding protein n=1 Tax=unclassified Streptomyces TaxID=2593676 RepID=UPI0036412E18